MKNNLSFLSYLLLIAAGILTIMAFVVLVELTKPNQTSGENQPADTVIAPSPAETVYFSDQNIFINENFGFSFYYPKDWFVSENGGYTKDQFIDTDKITALNGWIISTFNNPDYQLGKQAALIVKVMPNPNGLTLDQWLKTYIKDLGEIETWTQALNNYYILTDHENQAYLQLPSQEIMVLTAPCGRHSQCLGDKETNQAIFVKILQSLSLQ